MTHRCHGKRKMANPQLKAAWERRDLESHGRPARDTFLGGVTVLLSRTRQNKATTFSSCLLLFDWIVSENALMLFLPFPLTSSSIGPPKRKVVLKEERVRCPLKVVVLHI